MRNVTRRIALLTAALMILAVPVLAEDAGQGKMVNPAEESGKVECLLVARNSCDRSGTAESRIDKITNEINKGTAVYTIDELKILNNELDKARSELYDEYGGGA